ncbi:unnamed protein product [Meloidogyne enterolobii]|uniref:Uncharacterized protein n=1 Tax=Meloidogyne enterolobii TaxID=390850 RepID=A0ACB0ZVG7_MELEN
MYRITKRWVISPSVCLFLKNLFCKKNILFHFPATTSSISPVTTSIVPPTPPTPQPTTVIHPALALMQIQMLGQLASLSNQQRIFQQNNEQQQNCLKFLRQENSAFSINRNETTKSSSFSLIQPKEEENFILR